jgi:predicted DNA-binding ribbon-helix-helix protein
MEEVPMILDDEGLVRLGRDMQAMGDIDLGGPVGPGDADGDGDLSAGLVSRNVIVGGRRTSMRLEPGMWEALTDAARRERMSIHELVTKVAGKRGRGASLTCSVRAFLVAYYRSAATEDGHAAAGHGRLRDGTA